MDVHTYGHRDNPHVTEASRTNLRERIESTAWPLLVDLKDLSNDARSAASIYTNTKGHKRTLLNLASHFAPTDDERNRELHVAVSCAPKLPLFSTSTRPIEYFRCIAPHEMRIIKDYTYAGLGRTAYSAVSVLPPLPKAPQSTRFVRQLLWKSRRGHNLEVSTQME